MLFRSVDVDLSTIPVPESFQLTHNLQTYNLRPTPSIEDVSITPSTSEVQTRVSLNLRSAKSAARNSASRHSLYNQVEIQENFQTFL